MSNSMSQPAGLPELFLHRLAGDTLGVELVDWALAALEADFDSSNLRILASLGSSASTEEAELYFKRALKELAIEIPAKEKIIDDYVREIARKILADEIAPESAAKLIHNKVLYQFNHPEEYMGWCYLSGGLHLETYEELRGKDLEDAIKQLARHTLNRHS
jgi:hypothetical protein